MQLRDLSFIQRLWMLRSLIGHCTTAVTARRIDYLTWHDTSEFTQASSRLNATVARRASSRRSRWTPTCARTRMRRYTSAIYATTASKKLCTGCSPAHPLRRKTIISSTWTPRKSTLKDHLLFHTCEGPFKCPLCPLPFRQKQHVIRHVRCQYEQQRTFERGNESLF